MVAVESRSCARQASRLAGVSLWMLALHAVCSSGLMAQEPTGGGCLEGTVAGGSGVRVVGTTVIARSAETGLGVVRSTDPTGHFAFPSLPSEVAL